MKCVKITKNGMDYVVMKSEEYAWDIMIQRLENFIDDNFDNKKIGDSLAFEFIEMSQSELDELEPED